MSESAWDNARAADGEVMRTHKAWQAERDPVLREQRKAENEAAIAEAERLWDIYGPDPLLGMVKAESQRQAKRDSDPNPDDPDDEPEGSTE
jgi:hypothetical protein